MSAKPLPSQDVLRQLLRYEPETGKLFWRERQRDPFKTEAAWKAWNTRFSGKEVSGAPNPNDGYLRVSLWGRLHMAHRIAFSITHGDIDTSSEIDHINGVRHDNRISNLRIVSLSENAKNKAVYSSNRSGVTGVGWKADIGMWQARIKIGGKLRWLGAFEYFDAAVSARKAAEIRYGFHENHGRLTTSE